MKKFEAIRKEIKRLSDEQKFFKPLRKPSNKMDGVTPEGAFYKVVDNKYELRHLFQAYAILKGVDRPLIKNKELSESKVSSLVDKFREVE